MQFQPPRGELKLWSLLWIFFGVAGSAYYVSQGAWDALFLTIPVGLLAVGLWLRIKLAGILLLVLLAITSVWAIALLYRNGVFDWLRLLRLVTSGYFGYLVYNWLREFDSPPDA